MNIGQRIKNRRKELSVSADELARRLGKDRSTIYRYENGDIEKLPIDMLDPIAEALSTTPEYLMGWDGEEKEKPVEGDGLAEEKRELIEFVKTLSDSDVHELLQIARIISARPR